MPRNMGHQRRRRSHAKERGHTVFIIMMAILLLTSLGSWVVYSSGLAAAGAGNQRQVAQTLYIAEMGILAGTGYLGQPNIASLNFAAVNQQGPDSCISVDATVLDPWCKRIDMPDIDDLTQTDTTFRTLDLLLPAGSMGPYINVTEGYYWVEMAEPRNTASPGNPGAYRMVTLTSFGQVKPFSGALCSASENSASTLLGMRAHARVGPIN